MVQHELFLCKVQGAVWTFEHWNFMINNVLVEVCAEQGLQSEHGVTHGTLIYHPERQKKKLTLKLGSLQNIRDLI